MTQLNSNVAAALKAIVCGVAIFITLIAPVGPVRNRPGITSRFSRNMLSSPLLGAKSAGGQHGRLCTGNRTDDEAAVRLAERERSTAVCRHRGHQVGAWWDRVHRAACWSAIPRPSGRGLAELEGADDLDTGRVRKKGVDANG